MAKDTTPPLALTSTVAVSSEKLFLFKDSPRTTTGILIRNLGLRRRSDEITFGGAARCLHVRRAVITAHSTFERSQGEGTTSNTPSCFAATFSFQSSVRDVTTTSTSGLSFFARCNRAVKLPSGSRRSQMTMETGVLARTSCVSLTVEAHIVLRPSSARMALIALRFSMSDEAIKTG